MNLEYPTTPYDDYDEDSFYTDERFKKYFLEKNLDLVYDDRGDPESQDADDWCDRLEVMPADDVFAYFAPRYPEVVTDTWYDFMDDVVLGGVL